MARKARRLRPVVNLRLPAIEARCALLEAAKGKGLELDAAQMAALELKALKKCIKAYRLGLIGVLTDRYAQDDGFFAPKVKASSPRGGRRPQKFGVVRVRGDARTSLTEWQPTPGPKGMTFRILRGKGRQELPASFTATVRGRSDVWRRNGVFYVNKRGWLREAIQPVTTTSGLSVLDERKHRLPEMDTVRDEIQTLMRTETLKELDKLAKRLTRGKA